MMAPSVCLPLLSRCAVPWTGMQAVAELDGSVVIYASNALGDLFAKQLVREEEVVEEDRRVEEEVVLRREEVWLEEWGEQVASISLLPR